MPRAARTLLIVVVVGLVGLLALTWMARRYASLEPQASVADLVPATEKPAQAPPAAPLSPPALPPPAVEAAGPRAEDLREVDRFVAVRAALREVIAAQPGAAKQLAAQLRQGDASEVKPLQMNLVFLMKYRVTREAAVVKEDWTVDGYRRMRAAAAAWRAGTGPDDPAMKVAFDARRTALEGAFLGGLEALDRVADTGMQD